jgi:hypothetical protein
VNAGIPHLLDDLANDSSLLAWIATQSLQSLVRLRGKDDFGMRQNSAALPSARVSTTASTNIKRAIRSIRVLLAMRTKSNTADEG